VHSTLRLTQGSAYSVGIIAFVVATILMLLAACVPPTTDPDLYNRAESSQATASAAVAAAQYYSSQLTATEQSHEREMEATWQANHIQATERAWSANATATAQAGNVTATAQAWQATATQRSWDVTATADSASVEAFATAQAGQAASVVLAVERERMTNQVQAVAPWAITIGAFVVAVIATLRWTRVRVIKTGVLGDKPLLLDVVDGVVTDPDLIVNASSGITREDVKLLSAPLPAIQAQAKMRDQLTDLATRGTPDESRRKAAARIVAANSLPVPAQVQVQVIEPARALPMLQDVLPGIVRDAIEADVLSNEEKS